MDPSGTAEMPRRASRRHESEGRLLADSLRSSRLTLLYASAGASRRALLRESVAPLLGRRQSDVGAGAVTAYRADVPVHDRRRADPANPGVEHVVVFSQWEDDPLAALMAELDVPVAGDRAPGGSPSLVEAMESVCEPRGGRLLVVLEAVEALWGAESDASATARFVEAVTEVVNHPDLAVHILLAVDDRCDRQLDAFRRGIPTFDDSTVRMLGLEDTAAAVVPQGRDRVAGPPSVREPLVAATALPTLSDAIGTPLGGDRASGAGRSGLAKPKRPSPPPPVRIQTDGVYALIESTLAATADTSAPWHEGGSQAGTSDPHSQSPAAPGSLSSSGPSRPDSGRPRAPWLVGDGLDGQGPGLSAEPSSPIDEWLDTAIAWCRRMLRGRS